VWAVLSVECRGRRLRSWILVAKEAASGRDVRPGLARLAADRSRASITTTARILARAVGVSQPYRSIEAYRSP
jgi:hypothetical protein